MNNEFNFLNESEIIRRAERERSKAVGEFFARLFKRHENSKLPNDPVSADFTAGKRVASETAMKPEELAKAA